jgi:small subunit ribosomal protein S4
MRPNNVIFQLGMAPTILQARQLVNHRHILVNDHTINISSYCCNPQDFVTIKDRQKSQAIITRSMDYFQVYKTPNHLTLDSSQKKGLVNQIIDRELIGLKINELLVVEYYSCQA